MRVTFGCLYRRGRIWWWEYRRDGKRRYESLGTTSRDIANSLRKSLYKTYQAQLWPDGADHPLDTIEGLVKLSYQARGRPGTILEVVRTVKRFVSACPAKVLSQVTRAHVDGYVASRRAEGAKGKTMNKELSLLRAAVNRVSPDGRNPFSKYGTLREDDSRFVEAADPGLVARYLQHATGWVRDELLLLWVYGVRKSTMNLLKVRDVDLRQGIVRLTLWKTCRSIQDRYLDMPIDETLRPVLEANMTGKGPDDPVFPTKAKDGLRKAMNRLAAWHKLPRLHPHQLRHGWATEALGRGADLKTLMDAGGWKKVEMVLRYTKPGMEARAKLLKSVSAAISVDGGET